MFTESTILCNKITFDKHCMDSKLKNGQKLMHYHVQLKGDVVMFIVVHMVEEYLECGYLQCGYVYSVPSTMVNGSVSYY